MRIPKYIDKLLERRAKAAADFLAADNEIVKWFDKNGIEVSSDHILTGACSVCEPYDSIEIIRDCTRKKEFEKMIEKKRLTVTDKTVKNKDLRIIGRPGAGAQHHYLLDVHRRNGSRPTY